ncbi:MAG: hypothetical protein HY834_03510 [Devosia nanyangense]|uniref:Uncharacterized protein n=1 Tax=Devosia nanyangense TaxID=1228055 RepID=A0A933KZN6_9HYPH|nr:hypothetical protein [Devosia nanyangense]
MTLTLTDLEFPLESLRRFKQPGAVVLLTRDIIEPDELRSSIWDRIAAPGGALAHIVFEIMAPMDLAFRSGAEFEAAVLADYRNEHRLGADCYFSAGEAIGYSSARDTFGVLAVPERLLGEGELASWDRSFADHHNDVGVGFGEAGETYLRELLADVDTPRRDSLVAALRLD